MSLAARIITQLKWARRSSALRLALLLSLVFAVGLAAAIYVALSLGRDAVERRVDEAMQALAGAVVLNGSETSSDMVLRSLEDLDDLPRPFVRAAERDGGTIDLDRDFMRADVWRVLVTRDAEGTPVMVAVPLEDAEDAQEVLADALWTTAALVIVLTLAIGLAAGLLAQRRIVRINDTLAHLAAGDLTARTGQARRKDDLDDIARHLDHTASELERLVTQTRTLSASIAHDLRTPLARLRAQLEMLPEGEERATALEEAGRMSGIFDTIMRVARIEAAQGQDGFEPVALGELLGELEDIFGPVIEDMDKTLQLDVQAPATVMADRQMILQAMANLIQNALVHGGAQITLIAAGRSLGVADNGAGVDPAQFPEIIKPMVRLDAARTTEGSGLGLALVRAVADRHGATLNLSRADPQGLRVTLNFAEM